MDYWYKYHFCLTTYRGEVWGKEPQVIVTNEGLTAAWLLIARMASTVSPAVVKIELTGSWRCEVTVGETQP